MQRFISFFKKSFSNFFTSMFYRRLFILIFLIEILMFMILLYLKINEQSFGGIGYYLQYIDWLFGNPRNFIGINFILFICSGIYLLIIYLQGGFARKKNIPDESLEQVLNTIHEKVFSLTDSLEQQKYANQKQNAQIALLEQKMGDINEIKSNLSLISEGDQNTILKLIKEEVVSKVTPEIFNEIKEKIGQSGDQEVTFQIVSKNLLNTYDRLSKASDTVRFRSSVNLSFGLVTTFVGLIILYIYVSVSGNLQNVQDVIIKFIPRLSVVVFIEIFAYFFLKLYKNNLEEIKYYQNELTNVESKGLALITVILKAEKEKDTFSEVIKCLSNTERNRIFGKNQTTVELESYKIDKEPINNALKLITQFIKKEQK